MTISLRTRWLTTSLKTQLIFADFMPTSIGYKHRLQKHLAKIEKAKKDKLVAKRVAEERQKQFEDDMAYARREAERRQTLQQNYASQATQLSTYNAQTLTRYYQ